MFLGKEISMDYFNLKWRQTTDAELSEMQKQIL